MAIMSLSDILWESKIRRKQGHHLHGDVLGPSLRPVWHRVGGSWDSPVAENWAYNPTCNWGSLRMAN